MTVRTAIHAGASFGLGIVLTAKSRCGSSVDQSAASRAYSHNISLSMFLGLSSSLVSVKSWGRMGGWVGGESMVPWN